MGYDLNRFKCKIYDEVICCICFGVLESPYEIVECGHLFCETCIKRWIASPMYASPTCPIDRNEISPEEVRPAPEFIQQYINQLKVSCDFASDGCIVSVSLCDLNRHRARCPLNPMKPIACSRGCGLLLPPAQMVHHRCDMDQCQDAIVWNDIFEKARSLCRKRSYQRYQKRRSVLAATCKKFLNLFTKWMADPRCYQQHHQYQQQHYQQQQQDQNDSLLDEENNEFLAFASSSASSSLVKNNEPMIDYYVKINNNDDVDIGEAYHHSENNYPQIITTKC